MTAEWTERGCGGMRMGGNINAGGENERGGSGVSIEVPMEAWEVHEGGWEWEWECDIEIGARRWEHVQTPSQPVHGKWYVGEHVRDEDADEMLEEESDGDVWA